MANSEINQQQQLESLLSSGNIRGLIFDLDGVVTQTAGLHAIAWKKLFDFYLQNRKQADGKTYLPFSVQQDYPVYIDGIPRLDGIRNFLNARGITLPLGKPEDGPDEETLYGLGNLKNRYFRELIKEGVQVYPDTIAWIKQKRHAGFQVAIISASKNCREILQVTGLEKLFLVSIDGLVAEEMKLKGKPAPDVFLEAANQLGVSPAKAAIFEDALAGVKAGRAGGFGLVVGVNRHGEAAGQALREQGADVVITTFPEVPSKT